MYIVGGKDIGFILSLTKSEINRKQIELFVFLMAWAEEVILGCLPLSTLMYVVVAIFHFKPA